LSLPQGSKLPEADEYDINILLNIFKHNKNSTLTYGEIRHRALDDNPRMTNERQNSALFALADGGVIDEVATGRFRFIKPKPSPVVQAANQILLDTVTHQEDPPAAPPTEEKKVRQTAANDDRIRIRLEMITVFVVENPNCTLLSIADFMDLPVNTVRHQVNDLVEQGTLIKQSVPGKRTHTYRVTGSGVSGPTVAAERVVPAPPAQTPAPSKDKAVGALEYTATFTVDLFNPGEATEVLAALKKIGATVKVRTV
jgi:predicted transcriptional regulator